MRAGQTSPGAGHPGTVRILMLEDEASDADLIQHALRQSGLEFEARLEQTRQGFEQALAEFKADVILSDFRLPGFTGAQALELAHQRLPDVPVIMVTGELGDELAAKLIKNGARDFVLKDRLARLGPAVIQALEDASEHRWRVAQEHATLRSEQRFQRVLDNLLQLAVMLDRDGRITYANDHLLELTGWSRRGVIGQDWFELFIPLDLRDEVGGIFAEAMLGKPMARHYENEILTSAGARRLVRWDNTPLFDENDRLCGVASLGVDITDYRQATQALEASEERFRKMIESTSDIIVITETDGRIRYINPAVERLGGYPPEELIGRHFLEFLHPDDQARALEEQQELLAHPGRVSHNESRYRHRDGSWRVVDTSASNQIGTPGIDGLIVTVHDLTDIRQAQAALQERLKEIHCLHRVAELAGQSDLDESMLLEQVPPLLIEAFRYPQQACSRIHVDGQDHATARHESPQHRLRQLLRIDDREAGFIEVCYPDSPQGAGQDPFLDEERELLESAAATLSRSLTARRAQQALKQSEQLLSTVINAMPVRVFWKDRELRFRGCNALFARDAGFTRPEQLAGQDDYAMAWKDEAELYRADDQQVLDSGEAKLLIEEPQTLPDGRTLSLLTSKVPLRDEQGAVTGMLGVYMDITERKQNERDLARINRALRVLSAGNACVMRAADEVSLLQEMCQLLIEVGGFTLAWIGMAVQDEGRSVRPVAWAGAGGDYVTQARVSWDDGPRGRGPTGRCIREGAPQVARDLAQEKDFAPWREAANQQGFRSSAALPLRESATTYGALCLYSSTLDAFAVDELQLLSELADALAFGIRSLRTREANLRGQLQLAASLDATVRALAATVELRDPYTAGHQQRVATLATLIGRELGLSEERLKGLSLAASIHDIGKLMVPAEILSKPGRLSEVEYALIQGHAEAGHQLLHGIEFPWPIAEMVHQHHERLDGSGYPQGLKGDAIQREARIIAVADVVEAMLSHRPYRPARSQDDALEEIERCSGTSLDAAAVEACARLIRDGALAPPAR